MGGLVTLSGRRLVMSSSARSIICIVTRVARDRDSNWASLAGADPGLLSWYTNYGDNTFSSVSGAYVVLSSLYAAPSVVRSPAVD
jgi:hypothetical protein